MLIMGIHRQSISLIDYGNLQVLRLSHNFAAAEYILLNVKVIYRYFFVFKYLFNYLNKYKLLFRIILF